MMPVYSSKGLPHKDEAEKIAMDVMEKVESSQYPKGPNFALYRKTN